MDPKVTFTARAHLVTSLPDTFGSDDNPATLEYDRRATAVGMMIGGRNGGSVQVPGSRAPRPRRICNPAPSPPAGSALPTA